MTGRGSFMARLPTARNISARTGAEILGKLASLLLFALIARRLGVGQLGVFVLAFSFGQIAFVVIDLGMDRYLLREVARDRSSLWGWVRASLRAKALLALPVLAGAFALTLLLGYSSGQREAIVIIGVALFFDSYGRTAYAGLNAFERGDLLSVALIVQRLGAAAGGIAVLESGLGIVGVCAAFAAGTAVGTALAFALLVRAAGTVPVATPTDRSFKVLRASKDFAVQDLCSQLLYRLDTILLSVLATTGAVGLYGAAYRLLEATFFITQAISGAFAARFAYLTPQSDPPVRLAFERALKLAITMLAPAAIVLGLLAGPTLELFFGDGFGDATAALRLLAPVVVVMAIVRLTSSVIASQRSPRSLIGILTAGVLINAVANLLLIPPLGPEGAAIAMLGTMILLTAPLLRLTSDVVGGMSFSHVFASPCVGVLGGGVCILALSGSNALLAGCLGVGVYFALTLATERILDQGQLALTAILRDPHAAPPP